MNDIFDNMDAEALDWLSSALYHAAHSEDSSYVDPDYVDTQITMRFTGIVPMLEVFYIVIVPSLLWSMIWLALYLSR